MTAPIKVTQADFDKASAEVKRLQDHLDITNADHIALWLEANSDTSLNWLGWLACRIVEAHEAAVEAAEKNALERAWQPIETAPPGIEVEVRAGMNMTFRAILFLETSLDENERSCDQWVATIEGEHPPCWTDSACWASNANEVASLQPTAWRPLWPAPVTQQGNNTPEGEE